MLDVCLDRTNVGVIHIYAVATREYQPRLELVGTLTPPLSDPFLRTRVTSVKLSPCAKYLAVGTKNGTVAVYSMKYDKNIVFSSELQHNEHRVRAPLLLLFFWPVDA